MKKVITVLMAAIMTFGLATTAFAAGSPVANTTTIVSAVDVNGNSVAIVKKETFNSSEEQAAVDELKADPAKALAETKTDVNASAYTCVSVFDVVVDGDPDLVEWPIYLTFSVPEVGAGDTVVVLHYVDGAWQAEKVTAVEAGKIQVKFNSLSPVAIYVAKGETSTTDGEKAASDSKTTTVASGSTSGNTSSTTASTSTTSTTGKTSPQTGAAPIAEMMVVIAAMAVAGMCVTARRKDA